MCDFQIESATPLAPERLNRIRNTEKNNTASTGDILSMPSVTVSRLHWVAGTLDPDGFE